MFTDDSADILLNTVGVLTINHVLNRHYIPNSGKRKVKLELF